MPVKKYRDVSEMEGNTWHEPGSPELMAAIKAVWGFAARTTKPRFPPGVYKHRSIEEANTLRRKWTGRTSRRSMPDAGRSRMPDRPISGRWTTAGKHVKFWP